ncbi:hypothetical protein D3C72_1827640 [compost metagenome]
MQWHLHVQLGLFVHALEVDVQNELLVGVVLHVTQQHFGGGAGNFHVQNAGVECFLLESVPQCVVVQLDHLGFGGGTTVNDTRGLARIAETAARTRTLLGALKSDEVHS